MPIVIASRTIDLADPSGSAVQVSIMQPEPDGDDYRCEFEIVGLGEKTINSYGMGVDSTQALILTLQMIGARLYTSNEGKAGHLSWLGMKNLGFPVPDNIADLVPNDPRPSGMLFDFRYAPDQWHRTIDCADWPSAREIAIGVASDKNVEWVEIHSHAGASETWRQVQGNWEQANS
jgi:hypothetical protein